MNQPKRKLLGGGRANPRDVTGHKDRARPMPRLGSVLAALKFWEVKNGKRPHPFNAYYRPENGEPS